MSAFTYRVGVALRQKFGGFAHPEKIRNALPSLIGWGVFGGLIGITLLEPVPAFRYVLTFIPIAGRYWQNKLDEGEKKE